MGLETTLKRVLIPRRYHHRVAPIRHRFRSVAGVPESLDPEWLQDTARRIWDLEPTMVRHAPMGGYKTGSAYRVWLGTDGVRSQTLVFKNSALDEESYPAARGYPGTPGVAEWNVLGGHPGALARYLPAVFGARELSPGLHYQYLMEDLAIHYRPVLSEADVETAVHRLGSLHRALATWRDESMFEPTVRLDAPAAQDTLEFARKALDEYAAGETDVRVIDFLERWADVVGVHDRLLETAATIPSRLLHGDFNRKNVFLPAQTGSSMKLVDWEWMAIGPAEADLASILKRSPWGAQRKAVAEFFGDDEETGPEEHWQAYLWSRLLRSLIDAGLHANQNASGLGHTADDVVYHLERADDVLSAAVGKPVVFAPPVVANANGVPRVTIGLPVYNGERYLEPTIESILDQTYTDFRLIISDNASTDATGEIARRFAAQDERVHYLRREETVGAHYNYNGLLEQVESEYFKWAADDDLYEPDFLEKSVAMMDAHPEAVLAYTQAVDIDEQGDYLRERPFTFDMTPTSPVHRYRTFQGAGNACLPIFGLHRTDALKRTHLLGHYAASDRVLLAELSLQGPWYEVPQRLFLHREHQGRSMNLYPNIRMRSAWFNSRANGPDAVYWKRLGGYERGIREAPVSTADRLSLYGLLLKWVVARSVDLFDDVVVMIRGRTSPRQDARTSGD